MLASRRTARQRVYGLQAKQSPTKVKSGGTRGGVRAGESRKIAEPQP